MNLSTKKTKTTKQKDTSPPSEIYSLLELFPEAALLFNSINLRIIYANSKLVELSQYKRPNLVKLDLLVLLPKINENLKPSAAGLYPMTKTVWMSKHDQTSEEFQASTYIIPGKSKLGLIILIPKRLIRYLNLENEKAKNYLDALFELTQAINQESIDAAINFILSATCALTGAEQACYYQADSKTPQLNISTTYGKTICQFPSTLPAQELSNFDSLTIWKIHENPTSILHELAEHAHLPYLACIPIGNHKAYIGLIVFTGHTPLNLQSENHLIQTIGNLTTKLIQRESQSVNLIEQQKELSQVNKTFQMALEAINDGVIFISEDFLITNMNKAARELLGYSIDEVIGQPLEKILISNEDILPLLKLAQKGVLTQRLTNIKVYPRSGHAILVELSAFSDTAQDEHRGLVISIKNDTETEQLKTQINRLEHQALLGQYQRDFAHEVRNSINSIGAGLQLIGRSLNPEDPNHNRISLIKQDLDGMTELMETILSYTKISDSDMEMIDLGKLLVRIIDKYRNKYLKTQINLHIQIEENLPQINGHRRSLEQVFTNLTENALREIREQGGSLAVKAQRITQDQEADYIEISIADTGLGIPTEEKDRIFRPFHSTSPNGTGLGLVISQKLIEAHHGTIDFNSFLGGTIFTIRLPIKKYY